MKKILSLILISSLLHSGTITPAVSKWEQTKKIITSKQAMFVYGVIATAVTGGIITRSPLFPSRGKKVYDAVKEYGTLPEYLNAVGKQSNELLRFCLAKTAKQKDHYCLYVYSCDEKEAAIQLFAKTKHDLEKYNGYLKSIGHPTYNFKVTDSEECIEFYYPKSASEIWPNKGN